MNLLKVEVSDVDQVWPSRREEAELYQSQSAEADENEVTETGQQVHVPSYVVKLTECHIISVYV